jgi:isoleucyl-tRNA synthetase
MAALRHVLGWFEREGADAWFQHSPEELLPPGTSCGCGAARWRKENDILDVWFDSGSSHLAVLDPPGTPHAELPWPADMYLEGPDQYRGWFHSSLLIGVGVRGGAPYRQVLTHGWTLDEHGRPMSKSLGNVVAPLEICEKWGADLLRLWVASQDYHSDMRMSQNVMTQLSEAYRKIRNTFRFALGNLADFDPARDCVADDQLEEFDRWMLSRTAELVRQCQGWYASFDFHRVFHALHDFAVVDLSAFYFDVLKDRLYTFAAQNRARRSAQTAVYRISGALLRLAAPILAFTSEEIWKYFPKREGDPDSIHLAFFPTGEGLGGRVDDATDNAWQRLLALRAEVLKALEQKRNEKFISGSLEAKVRIHSNYDERTEFLRRYQSVLPALFIVSYVEIVNDSAGKAPEPEPSGGWTIEVLRADGKKCERCWNYSTHVGDDADYPTVCERCVVALREIEGYPVEAKATDAAPLLASTPVSDKGSNT